uniref:hypothetical protein n=1 Tax=Alistipes sp. TaxID=1872444 RepID=UPI0040579A3D
MNKKTIIRLFSVVAVALMGVGCQADYFNDTYLPGYDNNDAITNVRENAITLTEDDYSAIAKNSANKALAEAEGEAAVEALAAIGKNKYFATPDEAALYIPAYVDALYPTLDDGSLTFVTYTTALDIPEDVRLMNTVTEYTLTEDDYKAIWESDEDYAMAVTPATEKKLAGVLKANEDIFPGEYMVVTYNYSSEEPSMGEEPETPETGYTSVLGTAKLNDTVKVRGYVSAVSAQGPIITDNGGSVLLYKGADLAIGDEVTVDGSISAYNKGFQIAAASAVVEKTGTTTVTYPEPVVLDGAAMDALIESRTEDGFAQFVKFTGTPSVGNYINIIMEGAETAQGSIYGATDDVKAMFTDGQEATIYGYFVSISSGKFINVIVVSVDEAPAIGGGQTNNYTSVLGAAAPAAKTMALKVKSEKRYAYFKYNGTSFEATTIIAVQPSDYTEMGQTYGSFTNPKQDNYLPQFLAKSYPYAQMGDVAYVGYRCYANSLTSWKVDEYTFGGTWTKTIYFAEKTDQFRKAEGAWQIDRTLELDFTSTSSAETKAFYQYCCNWVYDFKDVPLGAPARDNAGVIISTDIVTINGEKPAGNYWVSNYGNNEFYTGASAYYGNMDWRPSAVKGGFAAAGMGDLTDDEILAKLKEHTAEVFAEVLSYVYPEMTPEEYKKVVIKVYAYGPAANYSFTFDVVDEGKFAYVEGSIAEL